MSCDVAEHTVLNGIRKIIRIFSITLKVASRGGAEAKMFTFSCTWTVPRKILKLVAGSLALLNVEYFLANANLSVKSLLL